MLAGVALVPLAPKPVTLGLVPRAYGYNLGPNSPLLWRMCLVLSLILMSWDCQQVQRRTHAYFGNTSKQSLKFRSQICVENTTLPTQEAVLKTFASDNG